MTKKIKKLEKETAMYRSRWESSNKALLEMSEEVKQLFSFCSSFRILWRRFNSDLLASRIS